MDVRQDQILFEADIEERLSLWDPFDMEPRLAYFPIVRSLVVVRLTPKGFWCVYVDEYDDSSATPFWRSYNTRKVSDSEEEALAQLQKRKRVALRHAKRRLRVAEERLRAVERATSDTVTRRTS